MVKLVILLLTGPFIEFDCSRYWCSSESFFFNLEIKGQFTGLSNQLEPSIVFDPSEFEGPRFDCACVHNYTSVLYMCTQLCKYIVHMYTIIQVCSTFVQNYTNA